MTLAMESTDVRLSEPVAGVTRVEVRGATVGYVLKAGRVFVTLRGAVYNTSCEIGQSLDRDTAVRLLMNG